MVTLLLHLLRLFPFLCGGHRQLALENLALRQQLAAFKRTVTRPKLRRSDRPFWVGLSKAWTDWRTALVIVTPETVLRWQRRRFRDYWTKLSGRRRVGRPSVTAEIRRLVTIAYYHRARTHLALEKDAPDGRPVEPPEGPVVQLAEVGGLHHRYVRRAA